MKLLSINFCGQPCVSKESFLRNFVIVFAKFGVILNIDNKKKKNINIKQFLNKLNTYS